MVLVFVAGAVFAPSSYAQKASVPQRSGAESYSSSRNSSQGAGSGDFSDNGSGYGDVSNDGVSSDGKKLDFLQPVERTQDNPQIHKQEIINRLPNSNIMRHALNTPYVKPEYKVYDFSQALSDRQIKAIQDRCRRMKSEASLDAAIVFYYAADWTDHDNEELCKDFYDYNDFGCGDRYDGVCVAINLATHRFAIFDTGRPCDGALAGRNLSDYTSRIAPYFRQDDFSGGVIAFLDRYQSDYLDFLDDENKPYYQKTEFFVLLGIALLLALIITSIMAIRNCKIEKAVLATNYERPNSFNLSINRTTFVSTHTTKVYIPPSSSSSGRGSSGTSHSGGSGGW